jgi:hypothetical protein
MFTSILAKKAIFIIAVFGLITTLLIERYKARCYGKGDETLRPSCVSSVEQFRERLAELWSYLTANQT